METNTVNHTEVVSTTVQTSPSKKKKVVATVPRTVGDETTMARRVAKGMDAARDKFTIKYASSADLRAAAKELVAVDGKYQSVLTSRSGTLQDARKKAHAEGRKFIKGAKKVFSFHLGDTWHQGWAEAGYLNDNLKSPGTQVECEGVLQAMARFLAARPEMESAPQRILATEAERIHAALADAQEAIDAADTRRKELRAARDKAEKTLRRMLNGVIHEIRLSLASDSPLWDSFGLTAPKSRSRTATADPSVAVHTIAIPVSKEGTVVAMAS